MCMCVCVCSGMSLVSLCIMYLHHSVPQCISVILVQWVAHWVQTIPGFVCMSSCHAGYCIEWALGSEACENPTLAHLDTVSCVHVCVHAHTRERQCWREREKERLCGWVGIFMCVGWEVVGERGHSTLKQQLSVLDRTERFFIVLLFH